jgi:hypothetical protein
MDNIIQKEFNSKFVYKQVVQPKYTDKHIEFMLDEFKQVLIDENAKYIESKNYKRFKKKDALNKMFIQKKEITLDLTN